MTKNRAPVKRFPPEMMNALVQGARSSVRIELPTRSDATALRQKLYMLRAAMQREQHFNYHLVERAEIKIEAKNTRRSGKNDPHALVIQPANVEYLDALHAAGITADSDDAPAFEPVADVPPVRETDYMAILKKSRENEEGTEQ